MRRVSVLIPTFRRPQGFLNAARSALRQDDACVIVGLDNTPERAAGAAFAQFAREAGARFIAAHEPRPGLAFARNAALAQSESDLVAWLDDDEEAAPGWLAALMRVQRDTAADVVFGPVRASAPIAAPRQRAYFERLYGRDGPAESGPIARPYGIGNSLMLRGALPSATPFDPRANESGGEDDLLFAAMGGAGKTFAWAADAHVMERVDAARLTFTHAMKRAFAYGQGPCELAARERDVAALARHMSVGAAQSAVFGAAAAAAWALNAPQRLDLCDRAARGLGKVLWFRTQRFYGAAA